MTHSIFLKICFFYMTQSIFLEIYFNVKTLTCNSTVTLVYENFLVQNFSTAFLVQNLVHFVMQPELFMSIQEPSITNIYKPHLWEKTVTNRHSTRILTKTSLVHKMAVTILLGNDRLWIIST